MDDPRELAHAVDAALAGAPGVDAAELRTRLARARGALLELLKTQASGEGGNGDGRKKTARARSVGCTLGPCPALPRPGVRTSRSVSVRRVCVAAPAFEWC